MPGNPCLLHVLDGFMCREDLVCQKAIINQRRFVAVADFGMARSGRRVLYYGYLKALFQQLTKVALDTEVGQHSTQDDLVDSPFTELKHEIVGLRPPLLVRDDNYRFSILDERLIAL